MKRNAGPRRRGRPPRDAGTGLTRDRIITVALDIAGAEGFSAVTMNRLATDLAVTPRALYNHIKDRQDVIDGVALRMIELTPVPRMNPGDWENSLREAYRQARDQYRRFPRAILISLDEHVTARGMAQRRIDLSENMLRFFVDLGLPLQRAIEVNTAFLLDIFSFALLIDYRFDRADPQERAEMGQPVPPQAFTGSLSVDDGTDSTDEGDPLSRAATQLPPQTSDSTFEAFTELRIAGIRELLRELQR